MRGDAVIMPFSRCKESTFCTGFGNMSPQFNQWLDVNVPGPFANAQNPLKHSHDGNVGESAASFHYNQASVQNLCLAKRFLLLSVVSRMRPCGISLVGSLLSPDFCEACSGSDMHLLRNCSCA